MGSSSSSTSSGGGNLALRLCKDVGEAQLIGRLNDDAPLSLCSINPRQSFYLGVIVYAIVVVVFQFADLAVSNQLHADKSLPFLSDEIEGSISRLIDWFEFFFFKRLLELDIKHDRSDNIQKIPKIPKIKFVV